MNEIDYTQTALKALAEASPLIRKTFFKQMKFLEKNLQHPGLHTKKYDEANDLWQGRVNRNWRFYFKIVGSKYIILDIIPHPK